MGWLCLDRDEVRWAAVCWGGVVCWGEVGVGEVGRIWLGNLQHNSKDIRSLPPEKARVVKCAYQTEYY